MALENTDPTSEVFEKSTLGFRQDFQEWLERQEPVVSSELIVRIASLWLRTLERWAESSRIESNSALLDQIYEIL